MQWLQMESELHINLQELALVLFLENILQQLYSKPKKHNLSLFKVLCLWKKRQLCEFHVLRRYNIYQATLLLFLPETITINLYPN